MLGQWNIIHALFKFKNRRLFRRVCWDRFILVNWHCHFSLLEEILICKVNYKRYSNNLDSDRFSIGLSEVSLKTKYKQTDGPIQTVPAHFYESKFI